MNVLVVDDEYYARKAVVKMVYDLCPDVETVCDAEDGQSAIEIVNNQKLDVVITDIRMPGVDGLELCKYIREHNPSISIIIVSGYADFDYAQQAIAYNVEEYLLKPVRKDKLAKSMNKVKKAYDLEKNRKRQQELLIKKFDKIRNMDKISNSIYENNHIEESFAKLLSLDSEPQGYYLISLQVYPDNNNDNIQAVKLLVKQTYKDFHVFFQSKHDMNEIILISFMFGNNADDSSVFFGKQCANVRQLIQRVKEDIGCLISAGISSLHVSTSQLSKAYSEARYALNYRLIHGWGRLFEFDRVRQRNVGYIRFNEQLRKLFYYELVSGKVDSAKELIKVVFEDVYNNKDLSFENLRATYFKILTVINETLREVRPETEEDLKAFNDEDKIRLSGFKSFDEVFKYLFMLIDKVAEFVNIRRNEDKYSLVDDVKQYVMEHYHNDISLEDLAKNKYYVNPSYLSKLFKSVTGESFSKFLLRVRMDKARELLEERDLNISQVARLVGYSATSYFVQIFKRFYGKTPGSFKNEE